MRRYALVLAALPLITSPALAQSLPERTGVNSALGVSPSTADFIKEVATSDMFEIESSKLAAEKGNAAVKSFAAQMIMDHDKTSSELKSTVSSGQAQGEIPAGLEGAMLSKLDKLGSLSGDDFNKQYVSDQVSAHKDAVSLFDRYSKGGDNDALKTWAATTLPALKHHLDMAEALNK